MNYAEKYLALYKEIRKDREYIADARKKVADGITNHYRLTIEQYAELLKLKDSLPTMDDALSEKEQLLHKMQYDFPAMYKAWCTLDASKIDEADMKLLSPLFADADTIVSLAEKHKNNATMMQAIRKYVASDKNINVYLPDNNDTLIAMNQIFSIVTRAEQNSTGYHARLLAKDGSIDSLVSQVAMPF